MNTTDDFALPSISRRYGLTLKQSVFAASKRLREIERIQKDSHLARMSIPLRQYEPGPLVRDVPNEKSIVNKYEQLPKVLGRTGPIVTEQAKSDGLMRGMPIDSFGLTKTAATPNIIAAKGARARRRRIAMVKSFRIKILKSAKDLPKLEEDSSEDSWIPMRWMPSTDRSQQTGRTIDESLRDFYRWVDSRPLDEVNYESTGFPLIKKIEHGPEIRRIEWGVKGDLRKLVLTSGIFRVYSDDGVHWDDERENIQEKEAVERLLRDL